MLLKDLTEEIRIFTENRSWNDGVTPQDLSSALTIEAAELLEHFQWDSSHKNNGKENKRDLVGVGEEIADVFIYASRLADILGLDMKDLVLDKLKKNAKKYPEKNKD